MTHPLTGRLTFTSSAAMLAGVSLLAPFSVAQENPAAALPPTFGGAHGTLARVPFDISDRLAEIRTKTDIPGMTAIMIDKDGVMALGAAGMRKAGGTTPVTINDKWHLGSCTKAMTATLCALLVNDSTLRWDSTIDEVFNPDRDEKSKITNNWKLVTLRQLTTCTANVPYDLGEYGGRPLWANLWEKARQGATPLEQRTYLFNELVKNNIGVPTTSFQYANASLAMAGHMAETVTKTPYEDLVRTRLFVPLGITTAGFGAPGTATEDGQPEDQPWGHTAAGKPMKPGINADNPASIAPAGTLHMSIQDWGRFARLHLIGAELSLPHSIDPATDEAEPQWDRQQTLGLGPADFAVLHGQRYDRNSDYAAGWIVTNRATWAKGPQPGATGRCLTHVGSNTMWTAAIWIAPEIDRAFLVVVNTGTNAGGDARELALQALIGLDRQWRGLPPLKQQ